MVLIWISVIIAVGFVISIINRKDVLFCVPVDDLYIFGKMSVQILCPIFNRIVWIFCYGVV